MQKGTHTLILKYLWKVIYATGKTGCLWERKWGAVGRGLGTRRREMLLNLKILNHINQLKLKNKNI